jgi:hypothetical protein
MLVSPGGIAGFLAPSSLDLASGAVLHDPFARTWPAGLQVRGHPGYAALLVERSVSLLYGVGLEAHVRGSTQIASGRRRS